MVKKIVGLQPCGSEAHAIEARCSELILAIQDLNNLFPNRELAKSEALACLNSIHQPNPQIMNMAKAWSILADAREKPIKQSLSEYIDSVREMYTENRYAVAMYGQESSTKLQLNFKKTRDRAQVAQGATPAKIQTPPKKHGGASANTATECRVCKKKHVEFYHACPLLKEIQHNKVKLSKTCCKLCLGPKDAAGKCKKSNNCHILKSKGGDTYNLLCKTHKDSHYSICTHCAPRSVKSHVRYQIVTMLRFRATPVTNPREYQIDHSLNMNEDIFLKLQKLTNEEVLLDHTTPLSEVVDVWNPYNESYTPSLVKYDCAGGLCLIQDGSHLNLRSQPEPAASVEDSMYERNSQKTV